jgi:hypothetical protein
MRVCSLRNLPPDDSRAYLRSRGIPEDRHAHLVALTHGHPLALSLVADLARQDRSSSAALTLDNPDIMRVLLDRFVESVPSEAHREALELCAHARSTSEELLGVLFEPPLAGELFEWLRSLSFVDAGPLGIYPHDVARDVLDADFRWRNPSEYRRIHGKVREFVLRRIDETQGTIKQQAFFDLQFLHRSSPALQGYYTWTQMGTAYAEPAKLADHPEILQMVERFEGMESATIARHWLARQPEGFTVFRDAGSDLIGFLGTIALRETDAEDLDIDPAVRAAWEFAQRHGPLRPGEQMLYHRFLMERDVYQAPSPAMEMAHMSSFFDWLATARLGWIFIQLADPDYWESLMSYYILLRVPEGDFEVGGRHYGVFAHDFRVQPILKWIDEVARRELADEATLAALKASMPAPIVVLSEQDFADSVRQALRDYTQPERLAANPLLRSRLVIEHADGMPDVPALQDLLQQAAESLHGRPRDEKLYRAVWRTYFAPAASQEVAAESLDLPFSTYRYQLTNGIERISAWLWEREVHGWSEQSA